jgi:cytochrome c-type biogenesis protein CcmF
VYNAILSSFNIESNLALPADQVEHYSKFQIWFSASIALLSGTAQYFYWKKIDNKNLSKILSIPFVLTALITSVVLSISSINKVSYIVLLTTAVYSLVANISMLIHQVKTSPKLSGGAVAHIGVALMLIGVLYSAGYSKVVSNNTSGLLYSKDFSEEMNRDNVLLWRNESTPMQGYTVSYKGPKIWIDGYGYFNKEKIVPTNDPYYAILLEDYSEELKAGDTIHYQHENTYYELELTQSNGKKFFLYPRAQVNKEMGLLASPDIKKMFGKDLYAHVSSIPDPGDEKAWTTDSNRMVSVGDTFLLKDYYAILEKVERVSQVAGIALGENDVAVKANIKVLLKDTVSVLSPLFIVHNQMVGRVADTDMGLGIRLTLLEILPQSGKFVLGVQTTQKDWIILKAMEKPWIDALWGGAILTMIGFGIAVFRRKNQNI